MVSIVYVPNMLGISQELQNQAFIYHAYVFEHFDLDPSVYFITKTGKPFVF